MTDLETDLFVNCILCQNCSSGRRGQSSILADLVGREFTETLESASTDLLIFYLIITQNLRNICADFGTSKVPTNFLSKT